MTSYRDGDVTFGLHLVEIRVIFVGSFWVLVSVIKLIYFNKIGLRYSSGPQVSNSTNFI